MATSSVESHTTTASGEDGTTATKQAPEASKQGTTGESPSSVGTDKVTASDVVKEWWKTTFCYCYQPHRNKQSVDPGDKLPASPTNVRRESCDSHVTDHPDDNSSQSVSPGRRKSVKFLDEQDGPEGDDPLESTSSTSLTQRGRLTAQSSVASILEELPPELRSLENKLTELFGTGFFKTVNEEDSYEGGQPHEAYDGSWGALELKLEVSEQQLKAKISEVESMTEYLRLQVKQKLTDGFLPLEFELTQYDSLKRRKAVFIGPPMYTHPGGYKFRIEVLPGGEGMSEGTHLCVNVVSLKGNFDGILTFPVHFVLTIQMLNCYTDTGHYTREIECTYLEPKGMKEIGSEFEFILRKKLYWNEEKQTIYVNNDKIKFRVTKILFTANSGT